jgi:fatty-acid desaturase
MTQKFYADNVLPLHIKHIKWLEKHHNHQVYFQEDNDPSHSTRSKYNLCRTLKTRAGLYLLTHPAQSPDLNPIESI